MARKASYTVNKNSNGNGANLGFEQTLWATADKLRGHVDPSEYKHVVLGLIFLKYISDAFDEKHNELTLLVQDPNSDFYVAEESERYLVTEDRDEYKAENIFWVPEQARWGFIQANAKQPTIGKIIDDAMEAIEKENPPLKGVLSKDYARPTLDKQRLGELVDLISTIDLGDKESRSKDILGRVYEYFLGQFAGQEGRGGGEHYMPRCVVRLLVEMIEPFKGRVYDPCCDSSGMFVQSEEFIKEHGGRINDISIFGQESNPTIWRLARMNLAIRGIEANLGPHNGDTFHNDIKEVESRIQNLRSFESGVSDLKIEQENLLQMARRDLNEREPIWREAVRLFNANSEALYEAPGRLAIDVKETGYEFRVEIERASSEGIASMKIFCYDLMLAQLWASGPVSPRLLIHDSTLYDGVDEWQKAHALKLAAKEAQQRGFQYICLLNSDSLPDSALIPEFDIRQYVRITLTDQIDGCLLGLRY